VAEETVEGLRKPEDGAKWGNGPPRVSVSGHGIVDAAGDVAMRDEILGRSGRQP